MKFKHAFHSNSFTARSVEPPFAVMVRTHAAGHAAGAPSTNTQPVYLWVDRHVARSGGRSTQQVMARLRRQGGLLHREALVLGGSVAYTHTVAQWRDLLLAASHCDGDVGASSIGTGEVDRHEPLRIGMQSDATDFFTSWLPLLRALRAKSNGCAEVRDHPLPLPSPTQLSTV